MNDIFGPGSEVENRVAKSHEDLRERVESCRKLGMKIVLTSGTWDLLHIGHDRYLEAAKNAVGNPDKTVLVVGIDSDEKTRARKGPNRPVISEDERIEMLCHLRHVDLVFVKKKDDPRHSLIKTVQPDVLIVSERNNEDNGGQDEISAFCGEIRELPSQATTSTTARIRVLIIDVVSETEQKVEEAEEAIAKAVGSLEELKEYLQKLKGRTTDGR